MTEHRSDVLVIGSGAGGATTAMTLAEAGFDVVVVEEGARVAAGEYGGEPTEGMRKLFRRRGMRPILGRVPIAFAEGCCVGGSTEINSGFWHRAPREILMRWKAQFGLAEASEEELAPHFAWAEQLLGVGRSTLAWPPSTEAFARGIRAMGWSFEEVLRAAPGCRQVNTCAQGCPTGAKQGMTRVILPAAERSGARVLPHCRVELILFRKHRVEGVVVRRRMPDGTEETIRLAADHVFVCGGPMETPALLRRSGVRFHIGDTLRVHPYVKMVARFPERMDAEHSVLPLLQVKEFWPEISMGGAYFTRGHWALMLNENRAWLEEEGANFDRMAGYYVGVKGTGTGRVRPSMFGRDTTTARYSLSEEDRRNLSRGVARLASLLIAAGAEAVFPTVYGIPAIRSADDAIRWLDELLPRAGLALSTVHAFSSCPSGERRDRCAADSFGAVYGFEGLYINDASILPDSPGVNPQGVIMALARRNALHFASETE
jgi:choline dehydrogenase-like flavoprotein